MIAPPSPPRTRPRVRGLVHPVDHVVRIDLSGHGRGTAGLDDRVEEIGDGRSGEGCARRTEMVIRAPLRCVRGVSLSAEHVDCAMPRHQRTAWGGADNTGMKSRISRASIAKKFRVWRYSRVHGRRRPRSRSPRISRGSGGAKEAVSLLPGETRDLNRSSRPRSCRPS